MADSRRRFLTRAGAAAAGLAAEATAREGGVATSLVHAPAEDSVFVPKVNDAINIQPLRRFGQDGDPLAPVIDLALVGAQLRLVYELGFDAIRVTAPFSGRGDFFAALVYARAARALGLDALVLVADFTGLVLVRALADARTRGAVLRVYQDLFSPALLATGAGPATGRIAFQILNEPAHFLGLPPDVYVQSLLDPSYRFLKSRNPETLVAGAAEVGTLDGPERVRALFEAGLESACDRVALHVYSRRGLTLLPRDIRALTWVTETGVSSPEAHADWVRDVYPEIRATLKSVSRIFHYVLFDSEPRRYRAFDIAPQGTSFGIRTESPDLVALWRDRVTRAAGVATILPFDAVLPDLRPYLPTPADVLAYDEALRSL